MISRSYIAITFGLGARSAALTLLVIILARTLGSDLYGGYAAALSSASFFATFSGLGAAALHVRDVSRGTLDHRTSLVTATSRVLRTSIPLAMVCLAINWLVIPKNIPPVSVALITTGELLSVMATDLAFRAMQARERYISMAIASFFMPCLRLLVAIVAWKFKALTFELWALASFSTGLFAFVALTLSFGGLRKHQASHASKAKDVSKSDALAGIGFTMSSASARVHSDADKVILARIVDTAHAGQYSVAYRLTDVLTLPVTAAIERLLPVLFRRGNEGFSKSMTSTLPLLLAAVAGGTVLSALGLIIAPIFPYLLGSTYSNSVQMERCLAFVPLTMAIWCVVRAIGGTTGHEKAMGTTELAGAAFNVVACMLAVSAFGWLGAVYATYATHLLMSIGLASWILLSEKAGQTTVRHQ